MSLNKFTDITEEHKWMNINCNSLVVNGNPVIPLVSNSYSSTPTPLTLDLTLLPAIGYYNVSSTGLKTFLTLTARLSGVLSNVRNRIDFLLPLPTGYVGLVGGTVVLTGSCVDATTGLNFQSVSSNVNPSNTSQFYILFNNQTAISGTFIINVSLTTEVSPTI